MNRLAQSLHCPRHCIPLVLFRWLLLAMTFVGMGVALWSQPWPGPAPLLALTYATFFLVIWTLRLPAVAMVQRGRIPLLVTDVVLSLGAAWLAGRWGYAMTPFVVGALMLPGALFGLPGATIATAAYLAILLLYRSLHLPGALLWGNSLPVEGAKAVVAAFIWPASALLQRRWPREYVQAIALPRPRLDHILSTAATEEGSADTQFTAALVPRPPAGRRSTDGPQPTTLERRATRLHPAIRQVVTEAQQHGLNINLFIEGREPTLPVGYVPLLVKAIDIALDNVRQHAHSPAAEIQLINTPATIHLHVRDHGAGLLDGTTDLPGFHHLKLLRYQLHELGGTLEITEPDDDGVLFALTLPITA